MATQRGSYLFAALQTILTEKWCRKMMQNEAAELLTEATWSMHITPFLQALHWLSINYWAQFKVLATIYKAFHGLWTYRNICKTTFYPCSATITLLIRARLSANSYLQIFKINSCLLHCGPQLVAIKKTPALMAFCKICRTELFKRAFICWQQMCTVLNDLQWY